MSDFRLLPLERVFTSTNSIVPNDRLANQGKLSHLRNNFSTRQQSSNPEKAKFAISVPNLKETVTEYHRKLSEAQYQWLNRNNETQSCPVSVCSSARQETAVSPIGDGVVSASAKSNDTHVKCVKFDSVSHSWVEGYRRAVDENPNSLRKYIEKLRSNPITGPSTAITNSERQRSAAMKVTKKVEFADNEYFAPSNNRPPKWHVFRSPRNPSFTVPPTRCSQNVFFCFKRAKNGFGKISIDGRFRQSGASRNHQSATRQLHDRQQLAKSYDNLRVSIARWSRSSLLILSH